jgi:hypothetical protein
MQCVGGQVSWVGWMDVVAWMWGCAAGRMDGPHAISGPMSSTAHAELHGLARDSWSPPITPRLVGLETTTKGKK